VLIVVCGVITEWVVEPRLGEYRGEIPTESGEGVSSAESRGLSFALYALVASILLIAVLTFPSGAPLRDPDTGGIVGNSPFMNSLIVLIMLVFLAMGAAYGIGARTITSMVDGINAVAKTLASLSGLVFLLFVISQFLAYFNYSNIATIIAVNLGDALEHANLGAIPLMLGFITITGIVGILIVGAIPKMGTASADLRSAIHEARHRARGGNGGLSGCRFAAKRRHSADALLRADCHLRAAL
jgi:aminobenzoyl-glutamate transport protein